MSKSLNDLEKKIKEENEIKNPPCLKKIFCCRCCGPSNKINNTKLDKPEDLETGKQNAKEIENNLIKNIFM